MATDTTALDPENVRVGATIKALREAHELKQAELGRLIGVSESLVCLIEGGKRRASIEQCRAIAKAFRLPLAAITVEGYEQVRDAS